MRKYLMMALVSAMMLSVTACEKDKLIPNNNSTHTESVTLGTDAQSSKAPVDAPVLLATPNPNNEVPDGTIPTETFVVVTPSISGTLPPKPEKTHELATLKPTDEAVSRNEPTATSKPVATSAPKPTTKPTSKPTAAPTVKPTSKPTATAKPTAKPTSKPTAKPTEAPLPEVTIHSSFSDYGYGHFEEVREEYTELFYDRVIYYINKFRAEEGQAPAVKHTKISQVAAFRAWQSENYICGSTKDGHECVPGECGWRGHHWQSGNIAGEKFGFVTDEFKATDAEGNPVFLSVYNEAFADGTDFYANTIDDAAANIAIRCRTSEGHWNYVGDEYYRYIGVGISEGGHDLFICVSEYDENIVNYHYIHNPNGNCSFDDCQCP